MAAAAEAAAAGGAALSGALAAGAVAAPLTGAWAPAFWNANIPREHKPTARNRLIAIQRTPFFQ